MNMTASNEVLISPAAGAVQSQFGDIWRHRDLLRYMVLRETYMVYANTAIGLFWVLLQPMMTALVLTLVFALLIRVPTGGVPYPLIILTAYPFFIYLNNTVTRGANSMRANAHLLSKVYFPRIIIVLAPLAACLIDLLVLLMVVLIAAPFYGTYPSFSWLALILPIILVVLLSLGMSLWLSQLTIYLPDVGHALPLILQVTLYLTPVIYPIALVPDRWRWFYDLNPMVGIVESARWAVLGAGNLPVYSLVASVCISTFVLVSGFFAFCFLEDASSDMI